MMLFHSYLELPCYRQQIEDSLTPKTEFDDRREALTTEGTSID